MYDYMKTIISALKHWVAEMIFKSTADWEQHDASQTDYVKNRTHYDSRVYDGLHITFDGNMSGYETVSPAEGYHFVKISSEIVEIDNLIGATAKLMQQGTIQEGIISSDSIRTISDGVYVVDPGFYVVHQTYTEDGLTLTPGIWSVCRPDMQIYVAEISVQTLLSGELKRIDHKYLPEDIGVQADWAEDDESSKAFILNKPTILQSDWLETDESSQAFILNKPDVSDTHLSLFDEEYNCVYRIEMRHGNLVSIIDAEKTLIDFEYTANEDGTYTLTSWKGTYRGEPSTRIIVPNSELFIV